MPWSIFTQGGGPGAAEQWAQDEIKLLHVPDTQGNEQFFYDWEVSEGGGGANNPLNQGPVPGHPELTSTGPQYGGGAADFVSLNAGLQGAADYLHMPAYKGILTDLSQNNPQQAEADLWASSWASSHYGYGSAWSDAPLPGHTSAITPADINVSGTSGAGTSGSSSGSGGSFGWGPFSISYNDLERLGLILLGGFLIIVGVWMLAGKQTIKIATTAAKAGAVAA